MEISLVCHLVDHFRLKQLSIASVLSVSRQQPTLVLVWFVSLHPSQQLWSCRDGQSTLPQFFMGRLDLAVNKYFVHILSLVTDKQHFLNQRREENGSRNYFMSNLCKKVWDRARIKLATPRSAVRLVSTVRHITDCATWPGLKAHEASLNN